MQLYSSGKKTKRHASLGTASRAAGVLRGDFCAQRRLRSPRLSRGGRGKRPLHAHPCPFGTWRGGGLRTPQPGGHWRVRPKQVSTGSRARFSDVQTPPGLGERAPVVPGATQQHAGPQSPQRRRPPAPSPRSPVPAGRSPRPVRRPRARPGGSDRGTSAGLGLGGRSHTVTGLGRDRGVRGARPADAAGSPSAGSGPTWTPYG